MDCEDSVPIPSPNLLLGFPSTILQEILYFLGNNDLLQVRLVNKTLFSFITSNEDRLKIEPFRDARVCVVVSQGGQRYLYFEKETPRVRIKVEEELFTDSVQGASSKLYELGKWIFEYVKTRDAGGRRLCVFRYLALQPDFTNHISQLVTLFMNIFTTFSPKFLQTNVHPHELMSFAKFFPSSLRRLVYERMKDGFKNQSEQFSTAIWRLSELRTLELRTHSAPPMSIFQENPVRHLQEFRCEYDGTFTIANNNAIFGLKWEKCTLPATDLSLRQAKKLIQEWMAGQRKFRCWRFSFASNVLAFETMLRSLPVEMEEVDPTDGFENVLLSLSGKKKKTLRVSYRADDRRAFLLNVTLRCVVAK